MKLSSRKQLLDEADIVLRDIRKKRLTEIDWEAHERRLVAPTAGEVPSRVGRFLKDKYQKELDFIRRKHRYAKDPAEMQKEIDELDAFMEKLKAHLSQNKRISRDPAEQSEFEKLIVNAPKFPKGFDFVKNYAQTRIQHPETGMWWSKLAGTPEMSPEMQQEYWNWSDEAFGLYVWDKKKGWWYNFIDSFLHYLTSGSD